MTTKILHVATARRWLGPVLFASLALAGCGGGGSADAGTTPVAAAPDAGTAFVPDSAFATTETLAAFQRTLTADDRAEPLQIGALPMPTDDRAEPFMFAGS